MRGEMRAESGWSVIDVYVYVLCSLFFGLWRLEVVLSLGILLGRRGGFPR